MEAEKKLDTIEEEMKLLKGELKQSLASVRDYLLNMELPSSEFSTILAALGNEGGGAQKITIDGNIANTKGEGGEKFSDNLEEVTEEEIPEPEDELSLDDDNILDQNAQPEDDLDQVDDYDSDSDMLETAESRDDENIGGMDDLGGTDEQSDTEDQEEFFTPDADKARASLEEEPLMGYDKSATEMQPSTPKVNLLANLINWVARAKKEIGHEELSAFLEVYGISGHLSPELKEAILQLAEITAEQSDEANRAEVWSQTMLSLHGILTGGDAPLYPFKSTVFNTEEMVDEEEIIEVDKPKEEPVKLKLVFPNGDGKSREFCVDLTPDTTGDDS
jgi:hypothetical protein